jgi:hypothetical protein
LSIVQTLSHLMPPRSCTAADSEGGASSIDPPAPPTRRQAPIQGVLTDLRNLFALGDKPTAEQLSEWLPDRWLLRYKRDSPAQAAG